MRTFHIGGAASRASAADSVQVKSSGSIRLNNLKTVTRENGDLVAVSRSGSISVIDEHGRERELYKLPYGAVISVQDDAKVEAGQKVDRKSTRLNSSHVRISYAVFCLKKKMPRWGHRG